MVKIQWGREQHIGIQRVEYDIMKPALHIELDDLIEYRNDLNEIIKKFEDLNTNWDSRLSELQEEGYEFEEIYTILKILYGDE